MKTKIRYEFIGSYCLHAHPAPRNTGNPFAHGWEVCSIALATRDYFGQAGAFLKDECARLGIPWLDFAPRGAPSPFIHALAREQGMTVAPVSEEEAAQSARMWAALQQGASIFAPVCSAPWCANYDEVQHLLPVRVDVSIHAPVELVDMLLSDLYDWNHGGE